MVILESKKVNIADGIDRITGFLDDAKFIIGDDSKQLRKLRATQKVLGGLIDGLNDEDAEVTYFSGSMDEFGNLQ